MTDDDKKLEQNFPHFDDYAGSKEITDQILQTLRQTADTLNSYANNIETDCAVTGIYLDITCKQSLVVLTSALFTGLQCIQERNVARTNMVAEMERQKGEKPTQ